ncbi:MAG: bifunctional phosphoribosyl-AMP cyclohydrolase/phosphoribosyl-ATP diphosphatase HisIE [Candidatus Kaiserbacteria bacterium]|nr:MAG: bifunctional phosphoribosyl-AMP cyclohydrolase/phosphoribosyl-ATP diphosphatase HisIE [Candidatus Kaiserbacteria bacterium]
MKIYMPKFEKRGGIIPAAVQDGITKEILMIAYVDRVAYLLTLATGKAHFFSTSRKKIWMKGEESGNVMEVIDVKIDCDGDAVVYIVVQKGEGVACHTGARTCFYRSALRRDLGIPAPKAGEAEALQTVNAEVNEKFMRLARLGPPQNGGYVTWDLSQLEHRLRKRAKTSSKESYTCQLLAKGVRHCAKKVGEEGMEVMAAASHETSDRLIAESADLLYHLLVLLIASGLSLSMVETELLKRQGKSGIKEKASRKKK